MTRDMTQGNITGHMLSYAVPLVFGNLFQQLYHTVDSVIVGQFNGKEALAAIGSAGPVMNILIFLIVGISMGSSILMAEYFGAKDYESLRKEMATSLTAGFLLTAVLTVASVCGSGLFVRLTRTPAEIAPLAADYLRIVSAGLFFIFLYNILAAGAPGSRRFQSSPLCADIYHCRQCSPGSAAGRSPGHGRLRRGHCHCVGPGGVRSGPPGMSFFPGQVSLGSPVRDADRSEISQKDH